MLWAVLSREGLRCCEAVTLRVGVDVDLVRGTIALDENTTDHAGIWALDPGVVAALRARLKRRDAKKGDWLFPDEKGGPIDGRLADMVRAHLLSSGVTRHELHNDGVNRSEFRVHALRGTLVTLNQARGESETRIADRTGHKSSIMIQPYRRCAHRLRARFG